MYILAELEAHLSQALAIGPLTYYLKPRLPISQRLSSREVNLSFLSRREFWLYQIPSIIQGLGFFLPAIYLPSKYGCTPGSCSANNGKVMQTMSAYLLTLDHFCWPCSTLLVYLERYCSAYKVIECTSRKVSSSSRSARQWQSSCCGVSRYHYLHCACLVLFTDFLLGRSRLHGRP